MAFKQAEHDFVNDPFIDDEGRLFFSRQLIIESIPIFNTLWEQKTRNRIPLCSRCNDYQTSRTSCSESTGTYTVGGPDETVSIPAVCICLTCRSTLCSLCSVVHEKGHNVFSLSEVFSNMFTAAAGIEVGPLNVTSVVSPFKDAKDTLEEATPSLRRLSSFNFDNDPELQCTNECLDSSITRPVTLNPSHDDLVANKDTELGTHDFIGSVVINPSHDGRDDLVANKDAELGTPDFIRPVVMSPSHDDLDDLNWPYALCTSPMGHVVVADTYNHRVLITEAGKTICILGPSDKDGNDCLSYPIGVTCFHRTHSIQDQINIAVADSGNSKIRIFNCEGKQIQEIQDRLKRPHGVCVCSDNGNIIVTDITNKRLEKYSFDGRLIQTFSDPNHGPTATHMKQPSYVECSGDESDRNMAFVSDTLERSVKVFDIMTGKLITTYGSFQSPHGLCYDAYQRTLMVADYMRSSVDVVDIRKGCVIGNVANVNHGLIGPTDLAFHGHTRQVLVIDTTRGKLRQFPVSPLPVSVATNFLD